jgi:hypothetical protein
MLFDVKKYKPLEQPVASAAGIIDDCDIAVPDSAKLQDLINLVDHGRSIVWVSLGDWSMHQLLQKLLEKIGPADAWISSYAFSEKPARTLCDLKATGVIKNLYCIIDSRVDVRSASALAMLRNACTELKLCSTHAKVTVLKNDNWFLVVGGSANYTTNKRIESGYISTSAVVASFNQKWIIDELAKL